MSALLMSPEKVPSHFSLEDEADVAADAEPRPRKKRTVRLRHALRAALLIDRSRDSSVAAW